MSNQLNNHIIRMAWEDRTSFDEIEKRTGLAEAEVIKIMRTHLKPGSFRLWRERVSGRVTKHGKRFKRSQDQLKKPSTRSLLDRASDE